MDNKLYEFIATAPRVIVSVANAMHTYDEKLMSDGQINFLKVRNRVIFSQEDIDAYADRSRHEAYGVNEESLKKYLS